MHYSFSSEFLKITHPATNFGEAWENLCLTLLRAEHPGQPIVSLAPPDCGIDIYRQNVAFAYQCKSSERGVSGTIEAEPCIASLKRALKAQQRIGWQRYLMALNAPLTGVGFGKIKAFAASKTVAPDALELLLPDYWSELCQRHRASVEALFDYRVFVSETQVIEALRKARYYDEIVQRAMGQLQSAPLQVTVSNNRTPIELVLPFSGDMTVEQLLDVARTLLEISLDRTDCPDLGTSCRPRLSLSIDRVPQSFNLKLSELTEEQRAKLQLWIQLIWNDAREIQRERTGQTTHLAFRTKSLELDSQSRPDRSELTIGRTESAIQMAMWQAASALKGVAS